VTALSAWTFGTYDGAANSAAVLRDLVSRGRGRVRDAVVVRWRASARAPQMSSLTSSDEMRQPQLLDLVVGVTYAVPLLQAALGTGHVEQAGALAGIGVDETFTNKMRDRLVPGTSALFVLSDDDAVEWLRADLDQPDHPDLVSIPLERLPGDQPSSRPTASPPAGVGASG
jgi:uncharacterized membrane protein